MFRTAGAFAVVDPAATLVGRIVGAIRLSRGAGDQDNRCAEAGVAALGVK